MTLVDLCKGGRYKRCLNSNKASVSKLRNERKKERKERSGRVKGP